MRPDRDRLDSVCCRRHGHLSTRKGWLQGANQSQQALAHMLGPLLAAVPSQFSAGAPYWLAGLIVVAGVVSVVGVAWALSVH
jgi:hypothetical protein